LCTWLFWFSLRILSKKKRRRLVSRIWQLHLRNQLAYAVTGNYDYQVSDCLSPSLFWLLLNYWPCFFVEFSCLSLSKPQLIFVKYLGFKFCVILVRSACLLDWCFSWPWSTLTLKCLYLEALESWIVFNLFFIITLYL
jgi:hypothetical protein